MRWLVVAALLVACKDKEKPSHERPPTVDLAACKTTLERVASAPLDARPKMLIDGCPVCADWPTILAWNADTTRPEKLQQALEGCNAFCSGDAKLKFMAGVDRAKGQSNDTPWRRLADACGDRIDASKDHRYMSAPYFALDRIARTLAPSLSHELAAVELPLPALSIAGTGVVLPEVDDVTPQAGVLAITRLGDQVFVGRLPRARLGAGGIEIDAGAEPYPGAEVTLERLAAALTTAVAGDKTQAVVLLAPRAMPAEKLVPVITAASPIAPLYLAAAARESPDGWQLPGTIPYALQLGAGGIQVTSEMTVQNLASEIHARRSGTLQGQ